MADKSSFEEPFRRAMDANLKYYEALGKVTQEYFRALFGVFKDVPIRLPIGTTGSTGSSHASAQPKPANASASTSAATLVLEAEAGTEANGVFLVENKLARTVSTAVMTSEFADPSGRAIRPTLRVVPNVVTLEPGGRSLVQIFAAVSDDLESDVPYRGEVSVPGLSDHGIPVMLRRKQSSEPAKATSTAPAPAADAGSAKGSSSKAKMTKKATTKTARKKTTAKKAATKKSRASGGS
jgi:hypothetical protein